MLYRFWSETNVIFFYIGFIVFFQAWLIVFLVDQLSDFIDSKMTSQKVIVISTDQLGIDDFWHIR